MANNVEINLKAKTTDFETGLDKAIKGLETFGKKGGEADKAMTAALKHINEAAKNNIDELQQNMARFNVKSDLRINFNLDVLAKAKEGVNALFDRIQSGGASIAETTAALNNMNAQMANLNSHQTRGQFKDLGIMSEASIEAMKVKAISAFAEIERSGVATPNDIIRAHEAMTAKIEELNALTVTQAEKTAAARINVAHEEALAEIRTYEEAASMNQKFEYEKQRSAEKTAAARMTALKEVAAAERASYAAQGMSGSGAAAQLIGQPLAGAGFSNDLRAQMEAASASAQIRSREMASYAASAMQGEAAAARLSGHVHAGSDFTAQLKSQMEGTHEATKNVRDGISGWSLASVAAIAKIQIMYSLINNIMSALGSMPGVAVDAIENYKSSIVSNAAMITSMQVGVRDIGAAYRENKIYAEAVQNVLIKMDAETAASGKNLIDMNNQFMQQGVLLDTNNKKQVDGFKNIANALAAITANDPNKDMQYAQEVRSMRDFSDRPGNRLVQYLKSQGVTKEMVEDWKKIGESTNNYGYLLEQLNPYFKGFAAAQGDINDLWETGKSTLVTIRDDILRGGLSEGFSHIITQLKELNKWAEENKFKIQAMVKDGFNQIETAVKHLWDMRGAFVALGETALYGGVLLGIGSIIVKVQELAKAITTMNSAASGGMLAKVVTNPVAAIGALVIGTTALAVTDSMSRKKAEAEANKIGAFTKQDILPGHVEEIRKKYGPISAQEIMGKFANSEIQLETVLSDSYDYIGQRVVFNEAAIAAAKVPYPKGIKTAGGKDAKGATVDESAYNSFVGSLRQAMNRAEPDDYTRKFMGIDDKYSDLETSFKSVQNKNPNLAKGLEKEYGSIPALIEKLKYEEQEKTMLEELGKVQAKNAKDDEEAAKKALAAFKAADKAKTDALNLQRKNEILATQEKITDLEFQSKIGVIDSNTLLSEKLAIQKELESQQQADLIATEQLTKSADEQAKIRKDILATHRQILETQKAMFDMTAKGGFSNALKSYAESATNMGEHVKSITTSIFKGMEDSLVSFVVNGKLNFKQFADAIISDMVRIFIQQQITGVLAQGMTSMLAGSSVSGATAVNGNPIYNGGSIVASAGTTAVGKTLAKAAASTPGANLSGTSAANASAGNTTFILQNNTGTQMKQRDGGTSFDGKQMVKTIILEALDTDYTFRNAVRG